ncbi:mercury transporter [Xylanivirga thermophila]|uniref:mercury transporter n=1 Tax=Xylanivirga thermophila TaxID=2496273 RepID=UPI00101C9C71|nr:mercury transporter [Xylanivirga thermophila]
MHILKELSNAFVWLIRIGTATRISYCYVKMINNDAEEAGVYKKRIRNVLVFYVLAESIWQLKDIAMYYFG